MSTACVGDMLAMFLTGRFSCRFQIGGQKTNGTGNSSYSVFHSNNTWTIFQDFWKKYLRLCLRPLNIFNIIPLWILGQGFSRGSALMSIKVTCPSCDEVFSVADNMRGKKVACRECDKTIVVPAAKTQIADEDDEDQD